jgi:hypothetical protein
VHIHENQTTNIAVLEFKNTFVLCEADFRPAMANASEAEQMLEDAFETDNETLLTGNAYWLSKQAKKYHGESHTADVASLLPLQMRDTGWRDISSNRQITGRRGHTLGSKISERMGR